MDIKEMIDNYANWLKNKISIEKIGEYYELTTPFMDRFNDYLQLYVKKDKDDSITLSDDGYIIDNLISSGFSMKSEKRRFMLEKIIQNHSLKLEGNVIIGNATKTTFPQKKHQMIQAMLTIDDMFVASTEKVKNFFVEDIITFFNANNIYYTPDFSFVGKSGSNYTYDFHLQKTANQPGRFCKALNTIDESKRNLTIFNWLDIQEKRQYGEKLIVIINDKNYIKDSHLTAFDNYEIPTVLFSKIETRINLFQAS